ncbi:MAG: MBL fold metallo-hydrolase [Acidobacteria bacterium]|nr:MBL fold metallo-hydrolase [Acidobacteriota bacterium]
MDLKQITIPTPLDVGPINVYLVRHDPLTLIDAGPKGRDSWQSLEGGLRQYAIRVRDIRRLVLTHSHEDHSGQAGAIQEASGCQIAIHGWELETLSRRGDYSLYKSLLRSCGVPQDVIERFQQGYLRFRQFYDPVKEATQLQEGALLDFEQGGLQVIHTPGHTPGSICLLEPATRTLIAGDTVLEKISPNPLLNPDPQSSEGDRSPLTGWQARITDYQLSTVKPDITDHGRVHDSTVRNPQSAFRGPTSIHRFRALSAYLESLKRLAELAPTLCWTGHGQPVYDLAWYRRGMEEFIAARQHKILSLLRQANWTPWLLSLRVFPNTEGVHKFLALSEITSHLDYAQTIGKAQLEVCDGVEYWRSVE